MRRSQARERAYGTGQGKAGQEGKVASWDQDAEATHLPRKHLGTVLSFRRRSLIKFTFLLIIM